MDRNPPIWTLTAHKIVALRKESVDRNFALMWSYTIGPPSLSARRAWIEIDRHWRFEFFCAVALRKESVDRNLYYGDDLTYLDGSLSARRAWIEILRR